jgi:hypothetical protein
VIAVIAVSVGSGLFLWTLITMGILLGIVVVIGLVARAVFRRGRVRR